MLESIKRFFSLSLLELSVYDLVVLILFVVSLVLTLIFALVVIATKVRKLDKDIENQISEQISSEKVIINYLDLIINHLSKEKINVKNNLEIRENIQKKELPKKQDNSLSLGEIINDSNRNDSYKEKEKNNVQTTVANLASTPKSRTSLALLENEVKNIPIERQKILDNVVENINTLSALEQVSKQIEEKIKQTEVDVKPNEKTNEIPKLQVIDSNPLTNNNVSSIEKSNKLDTGSDINSLPKSLTATPLSTRKINQTDRFKSNRSLNRLRTQRPNRFDNEFQVDKLEKVNNNFNNGAVTDTKSSRFNNSAKEASNRFNFKPLSLNLLKKADDVNIVSKENFLLNSSNDLYNNEKGQNNMYNMGGMNRNNPMGMGGMNRQANPMGGMNRNNPMGSMGGMNRQANPMGGMNRNNPMGSMGGMNRQANPMGSMGGMNRQANPMGSMGGMNRQANPMGSMNRNNPMGMGGMNRQANPMGSMNRNNPMGSMGGMNRQANPMGMRGMVKPANPMGMGGMSRQDNPMGSMGGMNRQANPMGMGGMNRNNPMGSMNRNNPMGSSMGGMNRPSPISGINRQANSMGMRGMVKPANATLGIGRPQLASSDGMRRR